MFDILDSQSDSSDATSTVKRWDCRWTPSEAYDSSGTSTTSEQGEEYTDYLRSMGYTTKSTRENYCNTGANVAHHANQSFGYLIFYYHLKKILSHEY